MKCISLWQPWATLMAHGQKTIETRHWATRHRGPILIHAAKKQDWKTHVWCSVEPFRSVLLRMDILSAYNLPFGALLGTAMLVGCQQTAQLVGISDTERAFGDYSPGRFGWMMRDFRPFKTPVPYRGAQGLFDVPESVIEGAVTL